MMGSPAKITLVAPDDFSFSAMVAAWVGSVVRSRVYWSVALLRHVDVAGAQPLGERRRQFGRAGRGGLRRLAHHDERPPARVQGGVAGPDGVLAVELGDHVVDRLVERRVGRGQVGPLVGGVELDLAVGARVAAPHAEDVQTGQLLLVGVGLRRSADGGERVELLGHGDGVGVRRHGVGGRAGGVEEDEVDVAPVHLVDVVEHRHVGLHGGERLGRRSRRTGHGGGQPARLGLVVDEVDGAPRHAGRGGAAVGVAADDGHAGRGVDARHLQPARLAVALGPPVVVGGLAQLGGRRVGDRHGGARDAAAHSCRSAAGPSWCRCSRARWPRSPPPPARPRSGRPGPRPAAG